VHRKSWGSAGEQKRQEIDGSVFHVFTLGLRRMKWQLRRPARPFENPDSLESTIQQPTLVTAGIAFAPPTVAEKPACRELVADFIGTSPFTVKSVAEELPGCGCHF
jgi:hypothetical protein